MLIISPDSNCDICLEQFTTDTGSPDKVPHAPRCGHVFCLGCLKALTRRTCPVCRYPFQPSEVTRLHLDQRPLTPSPGSGSPKSYPDPSVERARKLQDRVNEFVMTGASTSVAHELTEDCKSFFQEYSFCSHLDLHVAHQLLNHFLLGYYRAFFQDPATCDKELLSFQSEVQAYHQQWENRLRKLRSQIEDLTEKLHLETIARENEVRERETVEAVNQSLKDELQAQEAWWHWKYEELRRKYSDLQEEVSDLRGAEIQVMVSACPTPDFTVSKRRCKENIPPPLTLFPPSPGWDNIDASRKSSPQPPTYDYATSIEGCLSIISTPRVDECALRDEHEMKEMLSDLLTDPAPSTSRRKVFSPLTHMNSTSLRVSSAKYIPSPVQPHTILSSPMTSRTSVAKSQHTLVPPMSAPADVPLWMRKRSAVRSSPHPYNRDKGKATTPSTIARSFSASEAE